MRHAIDLSLSTRMWASPLLSPIDALSQGGTRKVVWFDPYDHGEGGTLYKDTVGTQPVAAAGDAIALRLDKGMWGGKTLAQVVASQPELATGFGPFTWTGSNAAYSSGNVVSAEKWYLWDVEITDRTAGTLFVTFRNVSDVTVGETTSFTTNGRRTFYLKANAGAVKVTVTASGAPSMMAVIHSIKEIPGSHALQATGASQLILARRPAGGRRNLLTYSEQFNNAAWTKSQGGTGSVAAVTANAGEAPDGTMTADQIEFDLNGGTTVNDFSVIQQSLSTGVAQTSTKSIWLRTLSGTALVALRTIGLTSTSPDYSVKTITTTWQRFDLTTVQTATAANNDGLQLLLRGTYGTDDAATILAWGGQVEAGAAPTAYQKVVSTHDVTEAGKRDCWWFNLDGSDDFDVTSSIDLTHTDKVATFISARKTTSSVQVVYEFSATMISNNGAFFLATEPAATRPWSVSARGNAVAASNQNAFQNTGAPDIAVITATHDIAGDLSTIRRNSVAGTNGTGDKGAGNFGNYPLYTGRRGGTSLAFPGQIGDQIICDYIPDAAVIASVEQRLQYKAGLV